MSKFNYLGTLFTGFPPWIWLLICFYKFFTYFFLTKTINFFLLLKNRLGFHPITNCSEKSNPYIKNILYQGMGCSKQGPSFTLNIPGGRRLPWFSLRSASLFKSWRMWWEVTESQSIKMKCNLCMITFKLRLLNNESEFQILMMISESPNICKLLCPASCASWHAFRSANNYARLFVRCPTPKLKLISNFPLG